MTEHEKQATLDAIDSAESYRLGTPEIVAERRRTGEPIFDPLLSGNAATSYDEIASQLDETIRNMSELFHQHMKDTHRGIRSHSDILANIAGTARLRALLRQSQFAIRQLDAISDIVLGGVNAQYIGELPND